MKNIRMILLLIIFTSCSISQKDFLDGIIGTYQLTKTGVDFIKREMSAYITDPVSVDLEIELRADGSIQLKTTPEKLFAQFQKTGKNNHAVYQLAGVNKFVSIGKSELLLIMTTNTESHIENVLFEHLVPVAVKTQ